MEKDGIVHRKRGIGVGIQEQRLGREGISRGLTAQRRIFDRIRFDRNAPRPALWHRSVLWVSSRPRAAQTPAHVVCLVLGDVFAGQLAGAVRLCCCARAAALRRGAADGLGAGAHHLFVFCSLAVSADCFGAVGWGLSRPWQGAGAAVRKQGGASSACGNAQRADQRSAVSAPCLPPTMIAALQSPVSLLQHCVGGRF